MQERGNNLSNDNVIVKSCPNKNNFYLKRTAFL